jgi:hypothetical protein
MKKLLLASCLVVLCASSLHAEQPRVKQIKAALQLGAGALGIYCGAKGIKQNIAPFITNWLRGMRHARIELDIEEAIKAGRPTNLFEYVSKEKKDATMKAIVIAGGRIIGGALLVAGSTYLLYRGACNFKQTEKLNENSLV